MRPVPAFGCAPLCPASPIGSTGHDHDHDTTRGHRTVTTVPLPFTLVTVSSPPRDRTRSRARGRPRPRPVDGAPLTSRSRTTGKRSSAIPPPLSRTEGEPAFVGQIHVQYRNVRHQTVGEFRTTFRVPCCHDVKSCGSKADVESRPQGIVVFDHQDAQSLVPLSSPDPVRGSTIRPVVPKVVRRSALCRLLQIVHRIANPRKPSRKSIRKATQGEPNGSGYACGTVSGARRESQGDGASVPKRAASRSTDLRARVRDV